MNQAGAYISMARTYGSKFIVWSSWLRTEQVLYVRKLMTSTMETEWLNISESYVEIDVWAELAKVGSARKRYAAVHNVPLASVTEEILKATAIGIEGYAAIKDVVEAPALAAAAAASVPGTPSTSVVTPEPKKKADPKRKSADPGSGKKEKNPANAVQAAAEKDAKEIISSMQQWDIEVTTLQEDRLKGPPEAWLWSDSYFKTLERLRMEMDLHNKATGNFVSEFKVGTINLVALKALRKTPDYLAKVHVLGRTLKSLATEALETTSKIKNMRAAALGSVAMPAGKPKTNPKKKARKSEA